MQRFPTLRKSKMGMALRPMAMSKIMWHEDPHQWFATYFADQLSPDVDADEETHDSRDRE